MTTNPLRADELRERIAQELKPKIQAVANSAYGAGGMADYECEEEAYDFADQVLALLTPPPSLASVVSEIDRLHAAWEESKGDARQLAEVKLFDNWPSIRTALTISGNGWRPIEEFHKKNLFKRPELRVFLFEEHVVGRQTLPAMVYHEPIRGNREASYWMPLPQPKTGDA